MARKETDKRITATIDQKVYDKLAKVAKDRDMSMSQLLRYIIDSFIHDDGSIGGTQFEMIMIRLNQVTDALLQLANNANNLQRTTIEGISSLLQLTRGDNYLLHEDDDDEPT